VAEKRWRTRGTHPEAQHTILEREPLARALVLWPWPPRCGRSRSAQLPSSSFAVCPVEKARSDQWRELEWRSETPGTDSAACAARRCGLWRASSKRQDRGAIGFSAPSACPLASSTRRNRPMLPGCRPSTKGTSATSGEWIGASRIALTTEARWCSVSCRCRMRTRSRGGRRLLAPSAPRCAYGWRRHDAGAASPATPTRISTNGQPTTLAVERDDAGHAFEADRVSRGAMGSGGH
jgi:hypothetical protein